MKNVPPFPSCEVPGVCKEEASVLPQKYPKTQKIVCKGEGKEGVRAGFARTVNSRAQVDGFLRTHWRFGSPV